MDTEHQPLEKPDKFSINYWSGTEPLWKAYWLNFVLAGYGLSRIGELDFISSSSSISIIYAILLITFYIWAIVGVWRCAFNTKRKFWGYLARFIVIAGPTLGIVSALYL